MGDPLADDITRRPHLYRNYAGKGVRIRVFWSSWWLRPDQRTALEYSFQLIKNADAVLRKYSLSLDCVPSPDIFSRPLRTGGLLGARVVVDCDGLTVPVWGHGGRWADGPKQEGKKLYDSLVWAEGNKLTENRLIVVFVPLGHVTGYCVLEPEWLPWVLVDPSNTDSSNLLLHEIGHACRLGHRLDTPKVTASTDMEEIRRSYRNVMSYEKFRDQLWNWQVDTIYRSYWCNGLPPRNWYNVALGPLTGSAWLWDE